MILSVWSILSINFLNTIIKMDELTPKAINGIIIILVLLFLISLPFWCCQVSDQEYQDIIKGVR